MEKSEWIEEQNGEMWYMQKAKWDSAYGKEGGFVVDEEGTFTLCTRFKIMKQEEIDEILKRLKPNA